MILFNGWKLIIILWFLKKSLRNLEKNEQTNESNGTSSSNSDNNNSDSPNEDIINILIKFVNEKEMKIQVKPNDTIHFLKTYMFFIIYLFKIKTTI